MMGRGPLLRSWSTAQLQTPPPLWPHCPWPLVLPLTVGVSTPGPRGIAVTLLRAAPNTQMSPRAEATTGLCCDSYRQTRPPCFLAAQAQLLASPRWSLQVAMLQAWIPKPTCTQVVGLPPLGFTGPGLTSISVTGL